MANNATVTLTFKVQADGTLKAVTDNINKSAKATDNLANSQTKASKAGKEHNYTQNSGIIGAANSTKSFSKLANTIGDGNNGLVGAYATLAANAFAVSAAFTALRSAAQAEQMMKGLEAQGARTGKSLVSVANSLQEITDYSISASEAMQATALMSSSGISSKAMKELTEVAYNASLALGRAVPDSLDRISKGVAKLEPELLDELGIMTKLSEAQSMYALQNNKTVASLTSLEKRQAMANAVAAEGQAKFGGLAEEVGANPYDKLAANFNNLVKDILIGLNSIVEPLVGLFSGSKTVLLGGMILFIGTIRQQLLPALYMMGKVAKERREEFVKMAAESKAAAKASLEAAKLEQQAAIITARANLTGAANKEGKKFAPKGYSLEKLQQGDISSAKELQAQLTTLNRSIEARERNLKKFSADRLDTKKEELKLIKEEKARLQELYNIQINGENKLGKAKQNSRKENLLYKSNLRGAQAEEKRSQAIELAGEGQLGAAWGKASQSVDAYRKKVVRESQASRVLADGSIAAQSKFSKLSDGLKTLSFQAGTVGRVAAAGFMKFLPIIGGVTLAIGAAWSMYEKFGRTAALKAQIEAFEKLTVSIDNAAKASKELLRLNTASIPIGLKAAQVLTIQANTTSELRDAFDEVRNATAKAETNTSTDSLYKALFGTTEDTVKYVTGIAGGEFLDKARKELESSNAAIMGFLLGGETGKKLGILFAESLPVELGGLNKMALESAKAMYQLSQIMDEDVFKAFEKSYGGMEKLANSEALQRMFIEDAADAYAGLADTVKQLQEAFKTAGASTKAYYQNLLPKTAFDDMVDSYRNINKEIFNLDSTIGGRDPMKQFSLLSSMPDEVKMTLTLDQNEAINSAQKLNEKIALYQSEITKINATEGMSVQIKKMRVDKQQQLIDKAKEEITEQSKFNEGIKESLRNREATLITYQEQEISIKSQQQMQSATMKAEQELYSLSAAGLARKIDMENKAIRLQQAQLKVQAAMIDLDINKQKLLLGQLQTKIELLSIEGDLTKEMALQNKIAAEERVRATREAAGQAGTSPEVLEKYRQIIDTASDAALKSYTGTAGPAFEDAYFLAERDLKVSELLLEKTREREDITNSIKVAQAAANSVKEQSAALEKEITSEATKQLELKEYNRALAESIAKKDLEYNDLLSNRLTIENNINSTLSGRKNVITSNIAATLRQNKLDKDKLILERDSLAEKTKIEIARIKSLKEEASITNGAIYNLTEMSKKESEILDEKISQLNITMQLAIYETLIGNGLEDSVSKLQEVIALEQKRRDLVSETIEKQTRIAQAQSEIAILSTGGTVDEKTQKQFAVENAKIAMQAAEASFELKIASIDAEYQLIDAKRQIDEDNFKTQSLLIRSMWEVFNGTTEMSASLKNNLVLIEDAATRVQNVDTTAMRNLAKQSAAQDLTLARLNYKRAVVERDSVGKDGRGSAIANLMARRASEERVAATTGPEGAPDTIKFNEQQIANAKSSAASLISILEHVTTLPTDIATAIAPKINSSLNKTDAASTAAQRAIAAGLNVGELKGYGKGLTMEHQDPGHKAGTAFDLSGGSDKAIQAQVEKAVLEGAKVIWKRKTWSLAEDGSIKSKPFTPSADAKGDKYHDRHAHISFQNAMIKGAESAAPAVSTIAGNAAAAVAVQTIVPPTKEQNTAADALVRKSADTAERESLDKPINVAATTAVDGIASKVQMALENVAAAVQDAKTIFDDLSTQMSERLGVDFGPQGKVLSALTNLMTSLPDKFKNLNQGLGDITKGFDMWKTGCFDVAAGQDAIAKSATEMGPMTAGTFEKLGTDMTKVQEAQKKSEEGFSKMASGASAAFNGVAAMIGMVGSLLKASSDAKIAGIDKEIAAEQKRDGKSAASVAKLDALEKKKDNMARKSFNTQKKLLIGQAIMSTAGAVAGALALLPNPAAIPLAVIAGAMGAAQIAIIAGTSYESSYAPKSVSAPTSLSIGKRSDTVDLARGPNANAGGEAGYLRGAQGTGTNATNYRTTGSAYGGELMRGYGNRGFVVGEKGPEVITPETPISVTPADSVGTSQPVNATFNIHAIDSQGVQDVLVAQKGNIIKMLRDTANASGKSFMEDVNVNVYTRPSVGKL